MKCIAIDDEPLALMVISKFCERQGEMEVETYCDPDQGMERILETRPDIVFLDVEMNDTSGLTLARKLPDECQLIFTTAHARYALDGFDLDAADFLHKPFSYERFLQAVGKVIKRKEGSPVPIISGNITLVSEYKNINFRLDQILCIEALGNYTKVYTKDQKCTLTHSSLKAVLQLLPEQFFTRIHRSYIISLPEVSSFSKSSVHLKGLDKALPVGSQFSKSFTEKMNAARYDLTSDRAAAVNNN